MASLDFNLIVAAVALPLSSLLHSVLGSRFS